MYEENIYIHRLVCRYGGFHTAMHYVGGKCVFASEWDKKCSLSYEANYKKIEPKLSKKTRMEDIFILMKI